MIEDNAIGAAVADNLTVPAHQLRRFTTSKASKERIIRRCARSCSSVPPGAIVFRSALPEPGLDRQRLDT